MHYEKALCVNIEFKKKVLVKIITYLCAVTSPQESLVWWCVSLIEESFFYNRSFISVDPMHAEFMHFLSNYFDGI